MTSSAASSALYERYSTNKGWGEEAANIDPPGFKDLLTDAGKSGPLAILDFGFGDGSFLDWARAEGHTVAGVEILPEAITRAKARGHDVATLDEIKRERRFDLVMAIDVLEHLDVSGFRAFSRLLDDVLLPDGRAVARFPNAASPFMGHWHYSDLTHDRPLNQRSLDQHLNPLGWQVMKARNPRPMPQGFKARLRRRLVYGLRDIVEMVIGFAYYGYIVPLDPNIVAVLAPCTDDGEALFKRHAS